MLRRFFTTRISLGCCLSFPDTQICIPFDVKRHLMSTLRRHVHTTIILNRTFTLPFVTVARRCPAIFLASIFNILHSWRVVAGDAHSSDLFDCLQRAGTHCSHPLISLLFLLLHYARAVNAVETALSRMLMFFQRAMLSAHCLFLASIAAALLLSIRVTQWHSLRKRAEMSDCCIVSECKINLRVEIPIPLIHVV